MILAGPCRGSSCALSIAYGGAYTAFLDPLADSHREKEEVKKKREEWE